MRISTAAHALMLVLVAAAWLGGGAVASPAALAGDAKVAETLLKSGKQALQKGDFASAATFFRKAQEEEPDLIEAVWWRASAQEKSGDKPAALAAYREFLELFAKKAAGAGASKEETRLKGLAEKSVDTLSAAEKELRNAEETFVAALLQFSKDNFVRDPGMCLKALELLLATRPDHEQALRLRQNLGGAAGAGAASAKDEPGVATDPFKDVKRWKDLIADRTFKSPVTYESGKMIIDLTDGFTIAPAEFIDAGTSYAYEIEFRVTKAYQRTWLTGLTFSGKKGAFRSAIVKESNVILFQTKASGEQEDLVKVPVPAIDHDAWHRLGVAVRGAAVEVWVDGKKLIDWKEPSGASEAGDLGLFQQTCRTETRVFRMGRFD